jgi:uncharacterized membrane protein
VGAGEDGRAAAAGDSAAAAAAPGGVAPAAADVLRAAELQFTKLGMAKTAERNGVLLFFAPACQQFAIVGDAGIHERCGQDFWHMIRDGLSEQLKKGLYTEAIVGAIGQVGEVLARHFPRQKSDRNELPDDIARD